MLLSILPLVSLLTSSLASTLFATHYHGNVYTLDFNNANLSIAATKNTCGDMPSWLTLDTTSRILYCTDETGDAQILGSQTTLSIPADGEDAGEGGLEVVAHTVDVGGGVNSLVYHEDAGRREFLAVAHYTGSALSTFALPLHNNQKPLQTFRYKVPIPGPFPQQNESHPHQVILDPTGSFILTPDLGADLIRVHAIDKDTGVLNECPSIKFAAGSGPRHGLFWVPEADDAGAETMLYTVSELGGNVTAFSVEYDMPDGCLGFKQTQSIVPYEDQTLPEGATPAGIKLVGEFIYVSIRSDYGFPDSDSMATLTRSADGAVAFRDITPSYGLVPRTFVVNKAGDLVAIGNQASSTVVIVQRDAKTGTLGDKLASLQVGEPGKVGEAEGLSSVIWNE